MFVKQLQLGPMENFVYLVGDEVKKECVVIDPAWNIGTILDWVASEGFTLKGAFVTHYHPDHCGGHLWGHDIEGVAELVGRAGVPVYCDKHECEGIITVTGLSKTDLKPLASGAVIRVGDVDVTAIHTPGHTPGSQCYLIGNSLVAGDTLFLSGCGRVDLPGGSSDQMYESVNTKLKKLPADTILYPGHNYGGASATMGHVVKTNPYLQVGTLAEWRRMFGG